MYIYIYLSNVFFLFEPEKRLNWYLNPTLKIYKAEYSALLVLCGGEGNVSCWHVIDRLYLYPITEKIF